MADTTAQKRAAEWVRSSFLKEKYGQVFQQKNCKLSTGGQAEFSAVSSDGKVLAFISTSTPLVPNGSVGRGKLSKVRADSLFLSMVDGNVERLLVYTDQEMRKLVAAEINAGKLPSDIRVLHAPLPDLLQAEVTASRKKASEELSGM